MAFWAAKSEGVGLIYRAINVQDFKILYHNPLTSQSHRWTDRRTDGGHAMARPRFAVCTYILHRAVETLKDGICLNLLDKKDRMSTAVFYA